MLKILKLALISMLAAVPFKSFCQSIEIIEVAGYVQGRVKDVDRDKYGIGTLINVFETWWPKPYDNAKISPIREDNTFAIDIETGGADYCAKEVALFVIPLDYPGPFDLSSLLSLSIANTIVPKTPPFDEFQFAGITFEKKHTYPCQWGPGPNYFHKDNAFVDEQGRLHLKISYEGGVWNCGEIISKNVMGYGTYKFRVVSDLSALPPNIVLGVFLYDENSDFYHREVDFLEFSNGLVVGIDFPYQYVIQPYSAPGQRYRFAMNTSSPTYHVATWFPGSASFASFLGVPKISPDFKLQYKLRKSYSMNFNDYDEFDPVIGIRPIDKVFEDKWSMSQYAFYQARLQGAVPISDFEPVTEWSAKAGVPPAGETRLRMNLWLHDGKPPGPEDQTFEVVIDSFEFTPMTDFGQFAPRLEMLEAKDFGTKIRIQVPKSE